MSTTLEAKQDLLAKYVAAECAVLKNQEYTIGNRTFVRADLNAIRKGRRQLELAVCAASGAGTIRVRKVIYRDD